MATFNKVWTSPETLPTPGRDRRPDVLARAGGAVGWMAARRRELSERRARRWPVRTRRWRRSGWRLRRCRAAWSADLPPGAWCWSPARAAPTRWRWPPRWPSRRPGWGCGPAGSPWTTACSRDRRRRRARSAAELAGLGLDPVLAVLRYGRDVRAPPAYPGPEAAARAARYAALDSVCRRHRGAAAILLGHTLDDQAETVLLGLARGSGARSLAGMAPRRRAVPAPAAGHPPRRRPWRPAPPPG